MKTNELMIGDWVHNNHHGNNIKIAQYDFFTHIHNECGEQELAPYAKPISGRDFEPIPLTPEILEKNEFKKFPFFHINEQHQWSWWENTLISVTLWCRELNDDTKDGMMLKIEAPTSTLCIKVNYVHEFQHALRLCGIEKEIVL